VVCEHFWHATNCLPLADLEQLWAMRGRVMEFVTIEPDPMTSPLPKRIEPWWPKRTGHACAKCSLPGWKFDKCPRCQADKDINAKACFIALLDAEAAAAAVK
jgi:hypothetical protein